MSTWKNELISLEINCGRKIPGCRRYHVTPQTNLGIFSNLPTEKWTGTRYINHAAGLLVLIRSPPCLGVFASIREFHVIWHCHISITSIVAFNLTAPFLVFQRDQWTAWVVDQKPLDCALLYSSAMTTPIQNPRLRLLNALRAGSKPILTFLGLPSFRTAQIVAQTGVDVSACFKLSVTYVNDRKGHHH
jgi:hypothetical protein